MNPDPLSLLRQRFADHVPGLMGAGREYAVLCPLVPFPDGLRLLFEVRAPALRQGGETCFPGGRIEAGERGANGEAGIIRESDVDCALRETWEELSIPAQEITILGRMDFIASQRGFLLRPIVGVVSEAGFRGLRPAPAEVAEIFTVPLAFFRDTPPEVYRYDLTPVPPEDFPYEAVGVRNPYPWAAGRVDVPVWYWQGRAIWGMTGRIVRELVRER